MLDMSQHLRIKQAAAVIRLGGVIAYPTEAVWGLGCDINDQRAVERILQLKNRHVRKGLIVVAASIEQLAPYLTDISDEQRAQLQQYWPGPFTWLVKDNGQMPAWVRGQFDSIALRVSAHPVVAGLCNATAARLYPPRPTHRACNRPAMPFR